MSATSVGVSADLLPIAQVEDASSEQKSSTIASPRRVSFVEGSANPTEALDLAHPPSQSPIVLPPLKRPKDRKGVQPPMSQRFTTASSSIGLSIPPQGSPGLRHRLRPASSERETSQPPPPDIANLAPPHVASVFAGESHDDRPPPRRKRTAVRAPSLPPPPDPSAPVQALSAPPNNQSEDDSVKVKLHKYRVKYDKRHGQASALGLCFYTLCYAAIALLGILMVNSLTVVPIIDRPYVLPQLGIFVDHFATMKCKTCNITADEYAQTFNITFKARLERFEATGSAPAVLATTSFAQRGGWWVAANTTNATDYLSNLNQRWSLDGGCYGRPGRLYVVVCLPREGIQFNKGDATAGPPFDDRCAAIGTRCGGTCGIGIATPPNCTDDGQIPTELLLSKRGVELLNAAKSNDSAATPTTFINFTTSAIDANTTDLELIVVSGGNWTFCFLFFSYLSLIIFLVNHCAPLAAFLEAVWMRFDSGTRRDTPWVHPLARDAVDALPEAYKGSGLLTGLDDMSHRTTKLCMIVCSVFAGEKTFHIFRNVLGVYTSWRALHQVCDELKFLDRRFFHCIVDNTGSKGVPMHALVTAILQCFVANPTVDWLSVASAMKSAPNQPTKDQYKCLVPKVMRRAIKTFYLANASSKAVFEPKFDAAKDSVFAGCCASLPVGTKADESKFIVFDVNIESGVPNLTVAILSAQTTFARGKAASLRNAVDYFQHRLGSGLEANKFFTIVDARHMMTPAFWEWMVYPFFIYRNVRFVQNKQTFTEVVAETDSFDRSNNFNYLYANNLRSQINSVTSCGTNAVWSLYPRIHRYASGGCRLEQFNFSGDTMIEDTESSHATFDNGENSVYISESLVFGSVKDQQLYGEAPARWSAGAIQLFFKDVRQRPGLLFLAFFLYILLPGGYTVMSYYVRQAQVVIFSVMLTFLLSLIIVGASGGAPRSAARLLIRVVNITYWLTGPATAIWWLLVMVVLLLVSPTAPFLFNTQVMVVMGLVVSSLQYIIGDLVKVWGGADEVDMWHSQQAWFALWPLNFVVAVVMFLRARGSRWTPTNWQSAIVFFFNIVQLATLVGAIVYCGTTLKDVLQDVFSGYISFTESPLLTKLVGIILALFSIALLFPTTIYLAAMFVIGCFGRKRCGKRPNPGSFSFSGRIFVIALPVVCLTILYGFNFATWTAEAFKYVFAVTGLPTWDPPKNLL